jgi:hypothetical protein
LGAGTGSCALASSTALSRKMARANGRFMRLLISYRGQPRT